MNLQVNEEIRESKSTMPSMIDFNIGNDKFTILDSPMIHAIIESLELGELVNNPDWRSMMEIENRVELIILMCCVAKYQEAVEYYMMWDLSIEDVKTIFTAVQFFPYNLLPRDELIALYKAEVLPEEHYRDLTIVDGVIVDEDYWDRVFLGIDTSKLVPLPGGGSRPVSWYDILMGYFVTKEVPNGSIVFSEYLQEKLIASPLIVRENVFGELSTGRIFKRTKEDIILYLKLAEIINYKIPNELMLNFIGLYIMSWDELELTKTTQYIKSEKLFEMMTDAGGRLSDFAWAMSPNLLTELFPIAQTKEIIKTMFLQDTLTGFLPVYEAYKSFTTEGKLEYLEELMEVQKELDPRYIINLYQAKLVGVTISREIIINHAITANMTFVYDIITDKYVFINIGDGVKVLDEESFNTLDHIATFKEEIANGTKEMYACDQHDLNRAILKKTLYSIECAKEDKAMRDNK